MFITASEVALARLRSVIGGLMVSCVLLIIILLPSLGSSETGYRLELTPAEAQCLLNHKEKYLSLSYDPLIIVPSDCPEVPFDGIDLSSLVQNSGSGIRSLIIPRDDFVCFIRALEDLRIEFLDTDSKALIEMVSPAGGRCD